MKILLTSSRSLSAESAISLNHNYSYFKSAISLAADKKLAPEKKVKPALKNRAKKEPHRGKKDHW